MPVPGLRGLTLGQATAAAKPAASTSSVATTRAAPDPAGHGHRARARRPAASRGPPCDARRVERSAPVAVPSVVERSVGDGQAGARHARAHLLREARDRDAARPIAAGNVVCGRRPAPARTVPPDHDGEGRAQLGSRAGDGPRRDRACRSTAASKTPRGRALQGEAGRPTSSRRPSTNGDVIGTDPPANERRAVRLDGRSCTCRRAPTSSRCPNVFNLTFERRRRRPGDGSGFADLDARQLQAAATVVGSQYAGRAADGPRNSTVRSARSATASR